MYVRFDYQRDMMQVGRKKLPLVDFRKWLVSNYETLVRSGFIKMILIEGKPIPTFDWCAIYQKANFTGVTVEYIQSKL